MYSTGYALLAGRVTAVLLALCFAGTISYSELNCNMVAVAVVFRRSECVADRVISCTAACQHAHNKKVKAGQGWDTNAGLEV